MSIWVRPATLIAFLIITVVAFVVSYLSVMHLSGTVRLGLPFPFARSSSVPPPGSASGFSLGAFLADLAVYYLLAVALVWIWGRFVTPPPG